jgi:lysophospholipase L1-like esterase
VKLAELGRQAGLEVYITTITPFDLTILNRDTSEFEPKRSAVNEMLRKSTSSNFKVCDIAADSRLMDPNNSTYYRADKIHFTAAGSEVIASLVNECVK